MHTIYFWDLLSLWLILVKFLLNLFSKVFRFIKHPSALLPPCMPCCILCLPSADPFITLFFEVTPRGGATTARHSLTFCSLVTFEIWLKRGREQEAGRVDYFLFRLPLSGPSGDGGDDMHVWCLQRVGFTAAKMNHGIIDSFRMQLLTKFFHPALIQRCCG